MVDSCFENQCLQLHTLFSSHIYCTLSILFTKLESQPLIFRFLLSQGNAGPHTITWSPFSRITLADKALCWFPLKQKPPLVFQCSPFLLSQTRWRLAERFGDLMGLVPLFLNPNVENKAYEIVDIYRPSKHMHEFDLKPIFFLFFHFIIIIIIWNIVKRLFGTVIKF